MLLTMIIILPRKNQCINQNFQVAHVDLHRNSLPASYLICIDIRSTHTHSTLIFLNFQILQLVLHESKQKKNSRRILNILNKPLLDKSFETSSNGCIFYL